MFGGVHMNSIDRRTFSGASSLFARLCRFSLGSLLILSLCPAWGQSTSTGRISGQVTDQQDSAIAGAALVLTDTSTNTRQSTVTNEVGRYLFLNVHPGIYDLTV